jgi:hypothetical protein
LLCELSSSLELYLVRRTLRPYIDISVQAELYYEYRMAG